MVSEISEASCNCVQNYVYLCSCGDSPGEKVLCFRRIADLRSREHSGAQLVGTAPGICRSPGLCSHCCCSAV